MLSAAFKRGLAQSLRRTNHPQIGVLHRNSNTRVLSPSLRRCFADSAKVSGLGETEAFKKAHQAAQAAGFEESQGRVIAAITVTLDEKTKRRAIDDRSFYRVSAVYLLLISCFGVYGYFRLWYVPLEELDEPKGLQQVSRLERVHRDKKWMEHKEQQKRDWSQFVEQEGSEEKAVAKAREMIERDNYFYLDRALGRKGQSFLV
ncbi:MAG: hypothetical protein M1812_006662 [Candelaria pacifica]|nr:MAG: hypothetical protein M1812_006662 [Candelaria pacifica]